MIMRRGIPRTGFKPMESDFDTKLNKAIDTIQNRCSPEWNIVLTYLQSLALVLEVPPEATELVKATYHKKALATAIVKRLGGLETIGE